MRTLVLAAVALSGATLPASSQQRPASPYGRAFELERRGHYAAAAAAYQELLRVQPAELNALLGLERSLHELGRAGELAAWAAVALEWEPSNPAILGLAVRAWAAAGERDSVRAVVARWSGLEPASEAPYREWGQAALAHQDHAEARQAYLHGRERLGRTHALAGELAHLASLERDWSTAVAEWVVAVAAAPAHGSGAVAILAQAPPEERGTILVELDRQLSPHAAVLAARLAARWGDPLSGLGRLTSALGSLEADATRVLTEFLDELRAASGVEAALARGRGLELLATRIGDGDQRARVLGDAARAYAEAGDRRAARRMLSQLSATPAAGREAMRAAEPTMIGVLIGEGRLAEAEQRLASVLAILPVEDADRLRLQLVRALFRAGGVERGEALLGADSSVEGLALRGRARLLRGDLAGATRLLGAAGPYALGREEATERVALLALLQVVDQDSLPALGTAFATLERGDTAAAARGFAAVGAALPPERGGAELLLLAGRLYTAAGAATEAESLLRSAGAVPASAAAPAARLELARLLVAAGRASEAVTTLEGLILEFPASAVAPQARRLLDAVRGGVPGR